MGEFVGATQRTDAGQRPHADRANQGAARAVLPRGRAEAIRAPTLLMAGERSPENFHRILDGLESALKDVRRVVIPNASHRSHVDNPKAFDREALAFLEE